jgi:hypothetical protein
VQRIDPNTGKCLGIWGPPAASRANSRTRGRRRGQARPRRRRRCGETIDYRYSSFRITTETRRHGARLSMRRFLGFVLFVSSR